MRLKTRLKSEARDRNECSASRCHAEPDVIDATHRLDDCDVYLCQRHWQERCDEDEAAAELKIDRGTRLGGRVLPIAESPA